MLNITEPSKNFQWVVPTIAKVTINSTRVETILQKLIPLTLPCIDEYGHLVQLWKTEERGMIGSVLKEGKIKIISSKNISTPFNANLSSDGILAVLENISLRRWSLIFNPITNEIFIIPYLEAAGKLGVDGHKGHLTRRDLSAAKRELEKGEIVALKESGVPFNPDPYPQVIKDPLQATYLVTSCNPSKLFAIQVPHLIFVL